MRESALAITLCAADAASSGALEAVEAAGPANGLRLRQLIVASGLTQSQALDAFNTAPPALFDAYGISAWKAFMADPGSARWRNLSDKILERAEEILGAIILQRESTKKTTKETTKKTTKESNA